MSVILVGMTWASQTLSNRTPTVSLLSWRPITSVLVNIFIMICFQLVTLSVLHSQNWCATGSFDNLRLLLSYFTSLFSKFLNQ